ncbi:hypothetical protein VF21_06874 [Pseudogymnoascus sp. 05NY08]|nr:hypothetical protein VF21_06874 [Pseudogymnoascus sp. 05NY08]
MNKDISQIQITQPLSPHRRRIFLTLIVLILLMQYRMDKRERLRQQQLDELESSGYEYESTLRDEKCAWRERDRELQFIRQEGKRRLEKWTQEQDQIFEHFYGGDGKRARTARHAYAAAPVSMVPPPLPRRVEVELRSRRRKIQKRRVGEARFGATASFDMDALRALGGMVGVKSVAGARAAEGGR